MMPLGYSNLCVRMRFACKGEELRRIKLFLIKCNIQKSCKRLKTNILSVATTTSTVLCTVKYSCVFYPGQTHSGVIHAKVGQAFNHPVTVLV